MYLRFIISTFLPKEDDEIVVIGQSFGGLICNNLHKLGRNILKSIQISESLNSDLFYFLEDD